jgi:hypothetical protein
MKKLLIVFLVLFVLASSVLADLSLELPLAVFVEGVPANASLVTFNSSGGVVSGTGGACNMSIYRGNGALESSSVMSWVGGRWVAPLNTSGVGRHGVVFYCSQAGYGGFLTGSYLVSYDGTDMVGQDALPGVILALLPILFGFLVLWGASLFDPEEHPAVRIFSHLLSWVAVFGSLWMGTQVVIKFYNWSSFTDSVGTFGTILGLLVFALAAYWIIYVFVKVIQAIKDKKDARLNA